MRNTHPLSCSQSEFAALAASQSERFLVRTSRTDKLLKTYREDTQYRIIPNGQAHKSGPLSALSFLSERFLLSVDKATVVCVWDMSKLEPSAETVAFPCSRLTLVDWCFVTHRMSFDHSTLYIILSKGARAHIFSLSLPMNASDADDPKLSFRDVAYFDTRSNTIQGFDVDSCLVLLELSHIEIEVVNWRTDTRSIVALRHDALGPMVSIMPSF
ncbi:hypothetical protein J3R82DRAFT_8504 [Butyriboletus roseoflavus]|nr:hypothetical protein J3R82DRAFT_8504 [Butyriboletus roseoflavus]